MSYFIKIGYTEQRGEQGQYIIVNLACETKKGRGKMEDFVKIKDLNIPSESLIGKGITAFLRSSQDVVYGKCERIRKDGGILIKTSSKIVSLGIGTQVKIFD